MNDWIGFTKEWNDATIGQRIAALMAFRGLSSRGMAELVGVSHAAICKYRNMEDFPSSRVLLKVGEALGVKASVLLGETRYEKLRPRRPAMSSHTCRKCGVELVIGQALQNTLAGFPDFLGETGAEHGCTVSESGPCKMIPCLKCPECGASYEIDAGGCR